MLNFSWTFFFFILRSKVLFEPQETITSQTEREWEKERELDGRVKENPNRVPWYFLFLIFSHQGFSWGFTLNSVPSTWNWCQSITAKVLICPPVISSCITLPTLGAWDTGRRWVSPLPIDMIIQLLSAGLFVFNLTQNKCSSIRT